MRDVQVTWRGIIHDIQGFSIAARGYILGLDNIGADVRVEPLNFGTPAGKIEKNKYLRLMELSGKALDPDKKRILVAHVQPWDIDYRKERERFDYVFHYNVFEPDRLHQEWVTTLNSVDAIFVPSIHNRNICKNSGVNKPVYIIPHGVDLNIYGPTVQKLNFGLPDGYFYFLSVASWGYRKAIPELIEAYFNEFSEEDKVCLILKIHYWRGSKQEFINIARTVKNNAAQNKKTAPLLLCLDQLKEDEIARLYRSCDCYVLPTRGEAVGLPYMEAMACKKPCIATNWGGQLDFINESNGFLLDYEMVKADMNDETCQMFFNEDMMFAEPDKKHLQRLMRYAYEHREAVRQKGEKACRDIQSWTWESSAHKIIESIESIIAGSIV